MSDSERTAYHEAGHAAAFAALGIALDRVTIEHSAGFSGRTVPALSEAGDPLHHESRRWPDHWRRADGTPRGSTGETRRIFSPPMRPSAEPPPTGVHFRASVRTPVAARRSRCASGRPRSSWSSGIGPKLNRWRMPCSCLGRSPARRPSGSSIVRSRREVRNENETRRTHVGRAAADRQRGHRTSTAVARCGAPSSSLVPRRAPYESSAVEHRASRPSKTRRLSCAAVFERSTGDVKC